MATDSSVSKISGRHALDKRARLASCFLRVSCVVVGAVLIAAGWEKVTGPAATERVLSFAGFAPPYPQAITGLLPGIEVALGVALLLGWSSRVLFGSAIALLLGFTGFLTFLAFARYDGACGCVGPLIDRWSGGGPAAGIVRNTILLALLARPTVLAFMTDRRCRHHPSTITKRVAFILVAAMFSVSHGSQAIAQSSGKIMEPWAPGFEEPLKSVFSDHLVEEIRNWFGMTESQAIVLQAFHEEHQAQFDAFVITVAPIREVLHEKMHALPMGSLQRFEALLEWETTLAEAADRQETVDMAFLTSIRSILDSGQIERWEMFKAWLSRKRWGVRAGMYLEQSVDLIALLDELERRLPATAGTVPEESLEEYAREMDRALRNLTEFAITFSRNRFRNDLDRSRTDGERVWLDVWAPDPKRLHRQMERRLSLNQRIRDVNHRYVSIFGLALPEPKATAWRRLYRETVLLRVDYKSSLSEETNDFIIKSIKGSHRFYRLVEQIGEKVTNLDDDQRQSIDAIVAQRDASLDAAFRRIVDAHDENADSSFRGVSPQGRTELEAKYRESLEAFAEVEQQSKRSLTAVLTPEQQEVMDDSASDK